MNGLGELENTQFIHCFDELERTTINTLDILLH